MKTRLYCLLVCVMAHAMYANTPQPAFDLKVPPGYAPLQDSKMDERGLWMAMEEAEQDLKNSPLLVHDAFVTDYVEDIVCRVSGDYCDDVRVYVVRNPRFNASMAPNGTMRINTGLLSRINSDDQLASIIGHELAHYTQLHSLRRLRAAKRRMTTGSLLSIGLAFGGIPTAGLPELFAAMSVMGFTRGQESEADRIGVHFMVQAGFDPNASHQVWRQLEAEERSASVERKQPNIFLSSHPSPNSRAVSLTRLAQTLDSANTQDNTYIQLLQYFYDDLMNEQVTQGDYGRLSYLLDAHKQIGINPADIAFFRGESWRLRKGAGDHEHAIDEYRRSLAKDPDHVRALRELGYLLYKHQEEDEAKIHLARYLELYPGASDREMVEFFISGGW